MRRRSQQLELRFRSHGGARPDAGRKPVSPRPPVHHVKRPAIPLGCPSHVTLRVRRSVPSLRSFGRAGPVLLGHYHLRVLRSPREVRHALAYVLLNGRKHWRQRHGTPPPVQLDAASSGAWFDGWKRPPPANDMPRPRAVSPPRSWMLRKGWRQHGLVDPGETPGQRR